MSGRHRKRQEADQERSKHPVRSSLFFLTFLLTLGAGVYYELTRPLKTVIGAHHPDIVPRLSQDTNEHQMTILLIGTDARPGDTNGNTDALIMAQIDEKKKRIALMSIPRDTQVAFPDGKYHKINQALQEGGPYLAIHLVENLLGIPIQKYALTRFDGLIEMIDSLGGIKLDVPEQMYYNTGDKQYNLIQLHAGKQTLSGVQALGFVRFRHDALGDIGRTSRQQLFLTALTHQLLEPSVIPKLPQLAEQMWHSIDTDLSLMDIGSLTIHAKEYASYPVIHETLPGSFHDPSANDSSDLSYWIVNPREARFVAKQFFEEGIVQKNPIQDPTTTQIWEAPGTKHNPPNSL